MNFIPMTFYLNTNGSSETFDLTERYIYGSSRVGVYKEPISMLAPPSTPAFNFLRPGYRQYELSNHLGNVTTTITAQKVPLCSGTTITGFAPQIVKSFDYSPFGVTRLDFDVTARLGGAFAVDDGVRYGFNGKEKDNEVKGSGNSYDFGARIYDPRLGRWLSVDPLAHTYPQASPYNFALNTVIQAVDPDGEVVVFINGQHFGDGGRAEYWNGLDNRVMNRIGDHNARYYDGASGGWLNTLTQLPQFGNLVPYNRRRAGRSAALANAKSIYDDLKEGESIKIISHSMGGAYAKGFIRGLKKYARENGKSLNVEFEVDMGNFQSGFQEAEKGVPTTQISHKGDPVAGTTELSGAKNIVTREEEPVSGGEHSVDSYSQEEVDENIPKSKKNAPGSSIVEENPKEN